MPPAPGWDDVAGESRQGELGRGRQRGMSSRQPRPTVPTPPQLVCQPHWSVSLLASRDYLSDQGAQGRAVGLRTPETPWGDSHDSGHGQSPHPRYRSSPPLQGQRWAPWLGFPRASLGHVLGFGALQGQVSRGEGPLVPCPPRHVLGRSPGAQEGVGKQSASCRVLGTEGEQDPFSGRHERVIQLLRAANARLSSQELEDAGTELCRWGLGQWGQGGLWGGPQFGLEEEGSGRCF